MSLEEKLKNDLVLAMKEKDKVKMTTLRAIKGAYQLEAINKKLDVNDDLILDCINKQIKMRNDSIEEFKKANREDLVDSYTQEVNILKEYMPKLLTLEELNSIIDSVFGEVKPTSIKDMGKIMKEITPKVKNRCDMKQLNELIKNKLEQI